jgi:two-component system response regulator MprA
MERVDNPSLANPEPILIIEDDPQIVDFLRLGLGHEKFEVVVANDGRKGIELFRQHKPALVILDLRLPDLDGGEVCQHLRAVSSVPILVLTARDLTSEKVKLLTIGADDYMVKPFSFDELLARIHALLRRTGAPEKQQVLKFLDIEMMLDTREVLRAGVVIELTTKDFELLRLFLSNPRQVLSKEAILNKVWGYDYYGDSNTVEVYVGRLRRKLGDPVVIQTVHGAGYALRLQR